VYPKRAIIPRSVVPGGLFLSFLPNLMLYVLIEKANTFRHDLQTIRYVCF